MLPTVRRVTLTIALMSTYAMATAAGQEHQHPPSQPTTQVGAATPLYDNLGTLHRAITTKSRVAQQYFDQGLRLSYGFNHDEAVKSFKEGVRQDSTCAMCYWGIAYALGPNINLPMDTAAARPAYDAVQKALKYSSSVSPEERAYIEAMAKRYSPAPSANRAPLDSAWARAIGDVSRRYPADDDAAALYGEALMDLRPWNYWTNGGSPKAPSTLEALRALDPVVKRNPDHPGACHFYIHAIEASNNAAKALPCAERLGKAMPGAGHLVHMPTHIYIRLGKWDIAADRNAHAVHADEQYISERQPTGVYPMAYYPHNYHMMWYALNMLGRGDDALKAARGVVKNVPVEVVRQAPPLEYFSPTVLYTLARFSRWDDILKEPAPPKDLRYTTGVWRYVRGLAYTGKGMLDSAAAERGMLVATVKEIPADAAANLNSVQSLLAIARNHLDGEIAAKKGRSDEAVKHLRNAIAGEDELTYDEPPPWYMPIRQRLGVVLLEAGKAAESEKAFRDDLVRRPENGWSLHGLAQSLRAQNRLKEAAAVQGRFEKAWARSDVELSTAVRHGSLKVATGVRLSFAERGDPSGEPVILLHGYSDSHFSFSTVLPRLSAKYHVFALDLRGHGSSDRPAGGYSMRQLAGDVIAFMDAKRLKRATIVGHSMGSFVAQQVALAAPNRVERLVLVGSGTSITEINGFAEFREAVMALRDPVDTEFAREFQVSTVHRPIDPVFMDRAVGESLRLPARVWHGLMEGMVATVRPTTLGAHRIPTLLFWGDRDTIFPRSEQDALLAMLPSATLKVYPETGHALHWERPEMFVRDLESFMAAAYEHMPS